MDPLTHAAFGPTLLAASSAYAQPSASRRGTHLAAVLGGLAPDVDAILMPAGWDVYLRAHVIGTHALVGTLPLAVATAMLAGSLAPGAPLRRRIAAAWIGCLGHIALDVVSGAEIQMGWPFVARRASLPLVAMAEPWMVALFAVTAMALWRTGLSRPLADRMVARVTLSVLAVGLVLKAALLAAALKTLAPSEGAAPSRLIEARWAHLAEWQVVDRVGDTLRRWSIAPGQAPSLSLVWQVAPETSVLSQSRRLSTVQNFLAVHDFGFGGEAADPASRAQDTDRAGPIDRRVLWSDLRFCHPAAAGEAPVITAPRDRVAHSPHALACDLWFGASLDRAGRPIKELVRVGGWWQERAPAFLP